LETKEEANNQKRKHAEKMTEKRRMETTEEGNIRRKIMAEKMSKN
jgi:hypothetical protein